MHPNDTNSPFPSRRNAFGSRWFLLLGFLSLPVSILQAQTLAITEFMADNEDTLLDEDMDASDWIEIQNQGSTPLDLEGYHLTDDALNLQKWSFPSTILASGERLVVFASGKNRAVSGSELHTNFSLSASGEYLGLIAPDGTTVNSEYAPQYPEQFEDISYGSSRNGVDETLVNILTQFRWSVPTAPVPGWQTPSFDDSLWNQSNQGVGFEQTSGYDPYFPLTGDTEALMAEAGGNNSVYLRIPFEVEIPGNVVGLRLRMRWDDGFAASVNNDTIIASDNAPTNPLFNSAATGTNPDGEAVVFQDFDLDGGLGSLVPGTNILAIQGMNQAVTSSDFLINAELIGSIFDPGSPLTLGYFQEPSPGNANGNSVEGFVADTKFSVNRGFFESPFQVAITSATPDAVIRYTTDGSEPTATRGTIYTNPLNITTTTTLRAAAFREGWEPTNVDTNTYIFASAVKSQPANPAGYPSTWGSDGGGPVPADYRMDPSIVNNPAYSGTIEDALDSTLPVIAISTDINNLFSPSAIYANGRTGSMEIPISLEYFDPNSDDEFQQNSGLRLHGGNARTHPKKPFRLYFRNRYSKGKLDFPLFPGSPVDSFDQLILRPGGHDGWAVPFGNLSTDLAYNASYMRDQFIRRAETEMGILSPRGKYVHVYINGLYWGVYDLHERANASFFSAHLGGDEEDWDVLHHPSFVGQNYTVVNGFSAAYDSLLAISNSGIDEPEDYEAIQEYLDIDGYIDSLISRIWTGDYDWDDPMYLKNSTGSQEREIGYFNNKNWYTGRKSRNGAGKFHFFSWDAEMSMGTHLMVNLGPGATPSWFSYPPPQLIPNFDSTRVGSPGGPAVPYRALRTYPEFQMRFGDRLQKHFFNDGALSTSANLARLADMESQLREAIVAESARWGDVNRGDPSQITFDRDTYWNRVVDWLRDDFIAGRTDLVLEQFRDIGLYPQVDAPEFSTHGGEVPLDFELSMSVPQAGLIYYTLDGSDPFMPASESEVPLITADGPLRFFVPNSNAWIFSWRNAVEPATASFADATGGVGFEIGSSGYAEFLSTDIENAMHMVNSSVYLRYSFNIADAQALSDITELVLRVRCDDGFVAFLNGRQVAVFNSGGSAAFNATAAGNRSTNDVLSAEEFDITAFLDELQVGDNVLAIQGLNSDRFDDTFLLTAELTGIVGSEGAPSPTAMIYTGPVPLTSTGTVNARLRGIGGEWSALSSANFIVGTPASASNTVISEINYRPQEPFKEAEIAISTDKTDYEYVEITNISDATIDLSGATFSQGIEFDFAAGGPLTILGPGESVLVVNNLVAFETRYGSETAARVAGTFANGTRLSNNGEALTLLAANGSVIQSFTYTDSDPWPSEADGDGYSLVLIDPESNPDPALPENWRHSLDLDGTPASAGILTYDQWKAVYFDPDSPSYLADSDPMNDFDGDNTINLLEYALASNPRLDIGLYAQELPEILMVEPGIPGQVSPAIRYRQRPLAQDLEYLVESTTNLSADWSLTGIRSLGTPVVNADGSQSVTKFGPSVSTSPLRYLRLKVEWQPTIEP